MTDTTDTQTQPAADTQPEQVTSKIPITKVINPKRVAAGKAVAEKTRQAREAQKKATAQSAVIIENDRQKKVEEPSADVSRPPEQTTEILTTTQWLSVISICVSLI